jgi:hypothetical protein
MEPSRNLPYEESARFVVVLYNSSQKGAEAQSQAILEVRQAGPYLFLLEWLVASVSIYQQVIGKQHAHSYDGVGEACWTVGS